MIQNVLDGLEMKNLFMLILQKYMIVNLKCNGYIYKLLLIEFKVIKEYVVNLIIDNV